MQQQAAEPDEVYLWPCNVQAWECWCSVQTQWRTGLAGRTGLDYPAVFGTLRVVHGLRGEALRAEFACLQAAELAVLKVQAERAEREADRQANRPRWAD
jgi:hypothetical protein